MPIGTHDGKNRSCLLLEINATERGKCRQSRHDGRIAPKFSAFLRYTNSPAHNIRAIARNFCSYVFLWNTLAGGLRGALPAAGLAVRRHLLQNRLQQFGDSCVLDVSKATAVGANIRQARIAKGLTLDQLARQSHLTRGYISLVERNLKIPSLAALLRMAAALEVNVANFFDPNAEPTPRYTLFRRQDGNVPLFQDTFGVVPLATGRTRKMMEPFLLSPPHKSATRASHAGEELLFVVNGKIAIKLDGEELVLGKGDCLYFSGETPHEVRSLGRQKAEVLVVVAQTS
ncbi:helix-turn-helix domain-containing protein [Bradyrhizobium liaoningense]